ncbi:MAG: hypothetical protein NC093_02630 [Alistipes sp.]|nr:hypothetical protein [Alistipes sp.]
MKLSRAAKHLILIILTALVLVIMLFIPELFLSYMDKDAKSVITEKNTPVTLELRSDVSLGQKAYIAQNGERKAALSPKHTVEEIESETWLICEKLINGPNSWEASDVYGDYEYEEDAGFDHVDLNKMEIKSMLPVDCTEQYLNESCTIWYVVANIDGNVCRLILDDDTLGLLDLSLIINDYPEDYIRADLMDIMSFLFELVKEYYDVMDNQFREDLYMSYIEHDTGFVRDIQMVYNTTVRENDGFYFFQTYIGTDGIEFSLL